MKIISSLDKVFIVFGFIFVVVISNLDENKQINNVANKSKPPKCFMETEADTGKPFDEPAFEKDVEEWFNCMQNTLDKIKAQQKI